VNSVFPALRNLTDNLSTLLVLGLVLGWMADPRWWRLTILALLSVLTREQNIVIVGIVLLTALWQRRLEVAAGMTAVLAVGRGWFLLLQDVYGCSPFAVSSRVFDFPFGGMAYAWTHLGGFHQSTRLGIFNALSLVHMGLLIILGLLVAARSTSGTLRWMTLAGAVMAVCATDLVWNDMIAYRRAFVWLPLGTWLAGVLANKTWVLHALTPAGLFSVAAALRYI
jgi:hypothetical protein